jgi:hypothetical protein
MKEKRFRRWFDLNLGWIFINGRKQEEWQEHLKKEYGDVDYSWSLSGLLYRTTSILLRVIGLPIMLVAALVATPSIILLILAEEIDSRKNDEYK